LSFYGFSLAPDGNLNRILMSI